MRSMLLVVLAAAAAAACGDDGVVHHLPDAPPAPTDAPDGPPAAVTIKVTIAGVAQPGVKIFFQRADSSLVSMKQTDAAGEASELVPAGAYVTALDPFVVPPPPGLGARSHTVRTYAGVKPGDVLRLDLRRPTDTTANITFIVPPDDGQRVIQYRLHSSCGSNSFQGGGGSASTITLTLTGCGTISDIVVESLDEAGSAVRALYHANVDITQDATVDLTGDTYKPATVASFNYTNIPAGYPTIHIDAFLYTAHGPLMTASLDPEVEAGNTMVMLSRADLSLVNPIAVTRTRFFNGSRGDHQVLDWGHAPAYSLDANTLLPEFQGDGTVDFATRTATWGVAGGVAQPDVVVVEGRFNREEPTFTIWDWRLSAPYAGPSVTFPKLVGDAALYDLQPTDNGGVFTIRTAKVPGGYDAVRPFAQSFESVQDLVAGGTGHVVYEELAPPPAVQARHR